MFRRIAVLAGLVVLTSGCFEIPGEHTLYLKPDGSVTWSVLEEEIRPDPSGAEAPRDAREEFLRRVVAGENDAVRALGLLHPASLDSRVLREDVPYAVLTEARFPAIDQVYRNLLDLMNLPATVELEEDRGRTKLVVTVWPCMEGEDESGEELEDHADMLLALFMQCRIVLTEGRFVDGANFEILEDGAAAVPMDPDTYDDEEGGKPLVLSLTWTREPAEEEPAR